MTCPTIIGRICLIIAMKRTTSEMDDLYNTDDLNAFSLKMNPKIKTTFYNRVPVTIFF